MAQSGNFSIGYRLSLYVSAIALFVVTVIALGIFFISYNLQVQEIENNIQDIENLTVPQITTSVWDFADQQIVRQIEALRKIRYLAHVDLQTAEQSIAHGRLLQDDVISREFDLLHDQGGRIGTLRVQFSLASARASVMRNALKMTGFVLIPLLIMAASIILLFRGLVTRHLDALAGYARSLTVDTLSTEFRLRRRRQKRSDELDRLLGSLNTMRSNMLNEIHHRREAEQRLSETQAQHLEVFNSTGDAIFIHDLHSGRILDVNQTMLDMYGCTHEEALSSSIVELSAEDQPHEKALAYLELAASGQPQVFEWHARNRKGEDFWVEVYLKSMEPNCRGRLLASVRDISARKAAEDKLLHIQKMETIGQLAGGIAHDFNNLLTGILGGAEMIAMETDDATVHEHVGVIVNAAQRAADLTGQLLAFSRRGAVVRDLQDIHAIVKDVGAILERSIDKGISLTLNLDASSCVVMGDRSQLQSAILNLGLNARDAMPEGGQLMISTSTVELDEDFCANSPFSLRPGTFVEICVRDTGSGMSEEVKRRAFEPFFTTKKVGQGTGLGLASVYGTIKGHLGGITLDSEVGAGSSFHIFLPVSRDAAVPERSEADEVRAGHGCILIIDDEEIVRLTARQVLERAGYRVLAAPDGEEGLEIFRRCITEVDLVVIDMIMPRMNGQETFAAIRALHPHARIIISSGFSRDETVSKLLVQGNAKFLRKPYRQVDLTRAIEELING